MEAETDASPLDRFRTFIVRNLQVVAFLGSYFLTVVLGQLLLASAWGSSLLERSGLPREIYDDGVLTSPGYWLLLLSPFVVTPIVATLVRRVMAPAIRRLFSHVQDFTKADYVVLTAALYVFVVVSFAQAGATSLLLAGSDWYTAVLARFEFQENVSFASFVVLQSLLFFLTIYSMVMAMTKRDSFWVSIAIVNVLVMTALLVLLNMKWPVVLLYAAIGVCLLVYSRRNPVLKFGIAIVGAFAAFLAVTALVWRVDLTRSIDSLGYTVVAALLRMSNPPYYYTSFVEDGPICGGVLEYFSRENECRPSTYVYAQVFGASDEFAGIGTSPAAGHITAFSLGGWIPALAALIFISIALGLFLCLDVKSTAIIGALGVVGAVAGYHFSQVPIEGPIIYDHGVLWTFLLVGLYTAWRLLVNRATAQLRRRSAPSV